MTKKETWTLVGIAGAAAALYYAYTQGLLPQPAQATPLSIYPEYGYTAQTSMAAQPTQQAATAPLPPPPTPYFTSVQQAEQAAIQAQCVGSNVCSPLAADTQLGM